MLHSVSKNLKWPCPFAHRYIVHALCEIFKIEIEKRTQCKCKVCMALFVNSHYIVLYYYMHVHQHYNEWYINIYIRNINNIVHTLL